MIKNLDERELEPEIATVRTWRLLCLTVRFNGKPAKAVARFFSEGTRKLVFFCNKL